MDEQLVGIVEESRDALVGDLVVHELPIPPPPYEATFGEAGEMHRGIGLPKVGPAGDLAGCERSIAQALEDTKTRRIGEAAKELRVEIQR